MSIFLAIVPIVLKQQLQDDILASSKDSAAKSYIAGAIIKWKQRNTHHTSPLLERNEEKADG